MALVNVEAAVKRFEDRLESDFYDLDRAKNTGEDYVGSGKVTRDTVAVEEFTKTELFQKILKMR